MVKLLNNVRTAALRMLQGTCLFWMGCSVKNPYVSNDSNSEIASWNGRSDRITYIRAYEEGGEFVLYGRVEHEHGHCTKLEHVDISIFGERNHSVMVRSLPLSQRFSSRQHGWAGASFRARITPIPASGSRLVIAVHDDECVAEAEAFECKDNAAMSKAELLQQSQ